MSQWWNQWWWNHGLHRHWLIVAELQPDEELPTMVQTIHPNSQEEPLTLAQGTSPIPPDKQPPASAQRTSPIPPDEQPPTVVQRISPVWPASPALPYKQLTTILQPASPVPVKSSHFEEMKCWIPWIFVSWISNRLGYMTYHMKKLLEEKAYNKRRSFHSTTYQDI